MLIQVGSGNSVGGRGGIAKRTIPDGYSFQIKRQAVVGEKGLGEIWDLRIIWNQHSKVENRMSGGNNPHKHQHMIRP